MRRSIRSSLRMMVGLAVCGLVGVTAQGGANAADPSLYFYPAQGWQLSKPAPQRCELKNSFDNGFEMRISGSNPGKGNVDYISIDFMQPLFGDGQSYPVQISVPAIGQTTVQALAENSQTLQLGLRGQERLYSGLESTGAFDLKIDSNEFRFYMTGLADAMRRFDDCTNGLSARPALVTDTVPNKPILQKPDYEPFKADSKEGVVEVTEILPEPSIKDVQEIDLSSPPFHGPIASVVMDSTGRAPTADGQRSYLAKMRNNEYGGMETSGSATVSTDILKDKDLGGYGSMAPVPVSSSLPATDRTSVSEVEKAPNSGYGRAEVNKEVIVARADFTKEGQKNQPFSGEFERINVRGSDSIASSNSSAMNQKVSELMKQVRDLQIQNDTLKSELEGAFKSSEKERLSISSDNWNLERATMRYNEAERQIAALGRQLQRQKIECEAEQKDLEAMLFDPKLTQEAQIAELSRLESENQRYKARIAELESRLGTQ